jgi:hypothetical protein
MSNVTLNSLMQQIKTLTLDEQRVLNKLLCANIRHGYKVNAIQKSVAFGVGDVITFDGKTRGPIFLEVSGFSRDRTKIKGKQINRGWKTSVGTNWTVGASVARSATREQALAA